MATTSKKKGPDEMPARCRLGAPRSGKPADSEGHAEADVRYIVRGVVICGLQSLPPRTINCLRGDQDVIEWFKTQGPGDQTRINIVLRAFRDASP